MKNTEKNGKNQPRFFLERPENQAGVSFKNELMHF